MAQKHKKQNPLKKPAIAVTDAATADPIPLYRGDREFLPFFQSLWRPLFVVLAVAAVVRFIHFFFIRANDPSFAICMSGIDTYTFDQWSQTILKGDWLSRTHPIFYNGPAYAYFLAIIYGIFGHSYSAAHLANFALGTLTSGLVYIGMAQWFSRRVAFVAGLIMALCSGVIFYEGTLLPEAFSFFFIASFLCLHGLAQNYPQRLYLWPLMGITLAIAAIQRASILLCVGGVVLWALFYFRDRSWLRRFAFITLFGAGIAMPLSLTFLHNFIIGKKRVLVTDNGPNMLYLGNSHDSVGTFTYPPSFTKLEEEMKTRKVDMTAELLKDIKAYPDIWIKLMAKKFYLFWASFDPPDNFSYDLFRQFSPFTRWNPVGFSVIIPLYFLSIGLSWRRWHSLLSLHLFIFLFCMSIVMIFIDGRYRIHILTSIVGFASLCLWYIYGLFHDRRYIPIAGFLAAVGIIMVLLNLYTVIEFRIRPNDFSMAARYFKDSGRIHEAVALLDKAERHYSQKPRNNREKNNQPFLVALMRSEQARYLMELQKWSEAEYLLTDLARNQMAQGRDYQMLVQVLLSQNKAGEAVAMLQGLARSNPDQPVWQDMLQRIQASGTDVSKIR